MSRFCQWLHTLPVALVVLVPGIAWPATTPFSPTLSGVVRLPNGRRAAHITLQTVAERDDFAGGEVAGGTGGKALFVLHTDGQGYYQAQLAPTELPIRGDEARFRGFLISPGGAGWAPLQLRVTAQHPSLRLNIRLRRGDQVHGVVLVYPGGTPKPGARVYAIIEDRLGRPAIVYETEADRAGRYTVPMSLPPGEYVVGAVADGYGFLAEDRRNPRAPGVVRKLTLRLIRDLRLHIQVLEADGLPLREHPVTVFVVGERSNVSKPGSEWGQDTRTDAAGEVVYAFHAPELYTPLSNAYRHLTVRVKTGDQASERVTVDAVRNSGVRLVLRLQSAVP